MKKKKYPKEVIQEIAGEINMGMKCYLNVNTMEVEAYFGHSFHCDKETEELFEETFEKIESWGENVVCIFPLRSGESFRIMEGFIDEIIPDNTRLKVNLLESIERRKPFRNFRCIIDDSDYLDTWYEYKNACIEKHVEEELENAVPEQFTKEDITSL